MVCKTTFTKNRGGGGTPIESGQALPARKRALAGLTLVEMLVGMFVAGVLVSSIGALWFYSNRSFAAQLNYVEMDQASQMALDRLSQQIRQVKKLVSESAHQLVFTDYDDQTLTFRYDPDELTLLRIKNGVTTTLLRDCNNFRFQIFQRNPVAGSYDQYPAATAANCKLVHVRWVSSRPLYGSGQENTESVSSAKIVIRNP